MAKQEEEDIKKDPGVRYKILFRLPVILTFIIMLAWMHANWNANVY